MQSQTKSKKTSIPPNSNVAVVDNEEEKQKRPNSTGTTNNTDISDIDLKQQQTRRTTAWIEQFCSEETNRFFCKVDVDFIQDDFNLIGLDEMVPHFSDALEIILDRVQCLNPTESCTSNSSTDDNFSSHSLTQDSREIQLLSSAERLYGLIHARYILTEPGLQRMLGKYQKCRFGQCIRYYCDRASVLPVGLSDRPGEHSVRLYCPRCKDIYVPHFSSKWLTLDGAYFGTGFPHMFFMVFPHYRPLPPTKKFVPTLYDFRLHPKAYEYQYRQAEAAEKANKPLFITSSSSNTATATTVTGTATIITVGRFRQTTSTTPNGQPPKT